MYHVRRTFSYLPKVRGKQLSAVALYGKTRTKNAEDFFIDMTSLKFELRSKISLHRLLI